jgi:hypothetical protein
MESVFLVWHVHKIADFNEDEKLIGVYRTEDKAGAAVARLLDKPGFKDSVGGFQVVAYELDKDHWGEGYETMDAGNG